MNRSPANDPMNDRVQAAFDVIQGYELLGRELYKLRARSSSHATSPSDRAMVERVEDMVATVSGELVQLTRATDKRSAYAIFIDKYRRIWRENMALFSFTAIVFVASMFLGFNIGRFKEDYVPLIVGQEMMETIIENRPWFETLKEDPALGAFLIMLNNMRVSLLVFTFGSILGIGGLGLLVYNGVFFGAIMGYCAAHHFDDRLTEFVVSHGFLELTVIVASAFASFLIGRTFYMRPFREIRRHLALGAADGFVVAAGVTPWMILAGVMEGFVSPMPHIAFEAKILTGLIIGSLFWVWTFWPQRRHDRRRRDAIVIATALDTPRP